MACAHTSGVVVNVGAIPFCPTRYVRIMHTRSYSLPPITLLPSLPLPLTDPSLSPCRTSKQRDQISELRAANGALGRSCDRSSCNRINKKERYGWNEEKKKRKKEQKREEGRRGETRGEEGRTILNQSTSCVDLVESIDNNVVSLVHCCLELGESALESSRIASPVADNPRCSAISSKRRRKEQSVM